VSSFVQTKNIPRGRPLPPEILAPSDLPLLKAANFDAFCLLELDTGFPTSHQPRFYAAIPQNGDKVPKFVVLWTISTIKDEESAAKFHYIKTLSGKVVAQSIAFRVVSIYW